MTLSKYNELMENIVVTEDMKSRILRNIELELDGDDAEKGNDKVTQVDFTEGKKSESTVISSAMRGRWASLAAAALVMVLSGIVVKSVIGDPSHSGSTAVMSEDSHDAAPAHEVMEGAAAEEAMDATDSFANDKSADSAKPSAVDSGIAAAGEAKDEAVAESVARFEYEEKTTLVAEYSIGHTPAVFHLAQVKNVSGDNIAPPYYTEFYQGNVKLRSIYLSDNMMRMSMGADETFGLVWGCLLENETDDVRLVVIDQKSPDKDVLFEKTYTMDELKAAASALPADYSREEQLSELFDDGVITE